MQPIGKRQFGGTSRSNKVRAHSMIRSNRLVAALAGVVLTLSSVALADEGLATEGKTIDGFNFRLPVYNADKGGATVVGLDKYVGPDAADKQTKILLLSFMASFCGPCKKEMPYLE